jgi:hypothetical protein
VSDTFKAEEHQTRRAVLEGWPVNIISYRLGTEFRCSIDNVDPGATLSRTVGPTREAAEQEAVKLASDRLATTRRVKQKLDGAREAMERVAEALKK